jgi:hypothetical protein
MSSVSGVTVTVALRTPRTVVTLDGPSTSSTLASDDRGTSPFRLGICRSRSPCRVVGARGSVM